MYVQNSCACKGQALMKPLAKTSTTYTLLLVAESLWLPKLCHLPCSSQDHYVTSKCADNVTSKCADNSMIPLWSLLADCGGAASSK